LSIAVALAHSPFAKPNTETLLVYETGAVQIPHDQRGFPTLPATVEELKKQGWLLLVDSDLDFLFHGSVSKKKRYESLQDAYAFLSKVAVETEAVSFGSLPDTMKNALTSELSSMRSGSQGLVPQSTTMLGIQPYVTLKIESPDLTGPLRLTLFGDRSPQMVDSLKANPLALTELPPKSARETPRAVWERATLGPVSFTSIGRHSLPVSAASSQALSRGFKVLEAWQRTMEDSILNSRAMAFERLVGALRKQYLNQIHVGQSGMSLEKNDMDMALSLLQSPGSHGQALSPIEAMRALQSAKVSAIHRGIAVSFACPSPPAGGYSIAIILIP
jgi:hypothetical protein